MGTVKIERLQARILETVATVTFQELRDPRMRFGSVTRVKLSQDLRHAKVFVSCLGTEADRRTFLKALESAKGKIQGRVAKQLKTRITPELHFEFDVGVAESVRMSALIDRAVAEDDEARAARGEPSPGPAGSDEE